IQRPQPGVPRPLAAAVAVRHALVRALVALRPDLGGELRLHQLLHHPPHRVPQPVPLALGPIAQQRQKPHPVLSHRALLSRFGLATPGKAHGGCSVKPGFSPLPGTLSLYDRGRFGLVLIGMPGLEKRLARYPQLYSRVGFVHEFRALGDEELRFMLAHHWQRLGLALDPNDFTDAEALAAIARITGGNFRLLERLFGQIERVLAINALRTVTREVVEAARSTLVIG